MVKFFDNFGKINFNESRVGENLVGKVQMGKEQLETQLQIPLSCNFVVKGKTKDDMATGQEAPAADLRMVIGSADSHLL